MLDIVERGVYMFNWNTAYSAIKADMAILCTECNVGRYKTPKDTEFPYMDISLGDNSGSEYTLVMEEGCQNPMIILTVYCNGSNADSICNKLSEKAKKIMNNYGFPCIIGPKKLESTDESVARWVARYQRKFGNGDELIKLRELS